MNRLYLLLFLCIFGISIKAQNWQTVYSDRVQYFDSGVNAIKIISKQIDNNGDSVFFNYPSLYLNDYGRTVDWGYTDSTSWIGKRLIIKANGDNGFIHTLNDTCIIKTKANNKESWSFVENDSVLIIATIDSIGYNSNNDITDSIKYISLEVIRVPSSFWKELFIFLDNKQVWLSKNHGVLRFPLLEYNLISGHNQYYWNTKPSYNQTKVNLFTNKNMFDFEVGDIIHSEYYSDNSGGGTIYRSWGLNKYISKNYDSIGDSVQYKIERRYFYLITSKNPDKTDVVKDTTFIFYTTYYKLSTQVFGIMPLSQSPLISIYAPHSPFGCCTPTEFYINKKAANCTQLTVHQEQNYFESQLSHYFTSNAGASYVSLDGSRGHPSGIPWTTRMDIVYVKNSCGEQGKDVTLNINNYKQETPKVTLYPNPANDIIIIEAKDAKSIELIDLQGKTILSRASNNERVELLNVSQLKAGIYIIKVIGANNISTQKIIIRH